MRRKNTQGCQCCEPAICVHASANCNSPGTWYGAWFNQFRFVPDEASPLVSGTPWRSVYHAQLSDAFDLSGGGFGLFTPQTICGPTYDPAKRRWRGYTDSPPAESNYAYRWHFEIESDQAMSVDPAAINCRRRFWVSDRQNNRLTDDFGMDYVPGFAIPGTTDVICVNVDDPAGDRPCGRVGHLVDFEYCMPQCVMNPPKSMKLSIDGLSSPNQGDMSGDYILEGGVKFPLNTGCPPNDPALGCPTLTQAGILMQPNQCPQWAYGRVYSYMPAGNPWCITPGQVGTIGQIIFGGAIVQIRYGVRYSAFNCFAYYSARYQLNDPNADPDQQGPLTIDWFGGLNTFHYWPPGIFGGQTDLAGCYFPPTLTVQFNSWT